MAWCHPDSRGAPCPGVGSEGQLSTLQKTAALVWFSPKCKIIGLFSQEDHSKVKQCYSSGRSLCSVGLGELPGDDPDAGNHLCIASPALGLIPSGEGGRRGLPEMFLQALEQQHWQQGWPEIVGCQVSTLLSPRPFSPHLHVMIPVSLGASSPFSADGVVPCLPQAQPHSQPLLPRLAPISPFSPLEPDHCCSKSPTHLRVCRVLKLGRNFECGVVAPGLLFLCPVVSF